MATLSEALSLALQHHQDGRLQEAEAIYRQILQVEPNHPDALHLLGLIAQQAGQPGLAVELIEKAIGINPSKPEFHNNIGNALKDLGREEEAVARYERALALKPDYIEAHYNLGLILERQGNQDEAIGHYRQALRFKPDFADALHNLGNVLRAQGRVEEAVNCYRQVLTHQPAYAPAHSNLGLVFSEQGRLEEAVSCYRQALALQPTLAATHSNLGNALQGLGRAEEAVAHYRQALSLQPDNVEAENQLMHQMQHLCDWDNLDELIEHQRMLIRDKPSAIVSPLTIIGIPSSPSEQLACARNWAANRLSPIARLQGGMGFHFKKSLKPKLRVGYLSTDFHRHATAYLIAELFELHDRARVEVCAYSYGPDDGSAIRQRLVGACDRFVEIAGASFEDAARCIYRDEIDILVDLKGYTRATRTEILALKPAPIQVSYLGYPGTMGADFIDYLITDRFISPPDQEPFFSEKFVYLPDCYQVNDRQRKIAKQTPTRTESGLPEDGFVFCCFNNTYKITPAVFDIWMRVLKGIPGSVLWLLEAHRGSVVNLRREAKKRGVHPERLVFTPRMSMEKHLARFRIADLFLDTFPYNAHTTASDALWAGLPVLTCAGETFASRVAGSLLTAIGLPELITTSLADYEALAVRLARSPARLAGLRKRLQKNRLTAPLFDSPRFTRHIESAYQMMWEVYLKGEAPHRMDVPALPPPGKSASRKHARKRA